MKKLLLSTLLVANGVAFAAPFVVKDIRIDGMYGNTGESLIPTLPVKIGQTATDNDVANVVRQLFLQKKFKDVSAVREGNTLVIKITEFPIINNVTVNGNAAIPKEPLEQNLKANLISRGEVFDAARLEAFKQSLVDHYHSIGRYNAQVESVLDKTENGSLNIALNITENDVSYVKKINFEGNRDFSSKELTKLLDIQPNVSWWNIFQSSKFEQAAYQQDLDTLRDFYMNRGYATFNIESTDVKFSDDKKEVFLTYKINEGEKYNISEIRIVGNTAKMDRELNQVLKGFKAGQLFRRDDLAKFEAGMNEVFGENGFASAKIDVYPIFDYDRKAVRINFVVDAGQRIYVRRIRFQGNDITADSTLRREMRQQEGAWLSTNLTNLGKARLERTGFYDSVEMSLPMVPNKQDQVDVVYKIKERNTGSINFGVGYGSENGFSYQAGIKQDNFLGMGSSISLNGTRNDYGNSLNFGYTEPYFTKDGVSLGGNLFYEDYDNSKSSTAASYKRRTYGFNNTLGFPVDENNSYYLGLGYVHDVIKNAQREYSRDQFVKSLGIPVDETLNLYRKIRTNDFDFSFGWNYNSLNRGFFATKGSTASFGGKVTIPGSTNKYYKLNADFRNYYPLNREHKWVISSKVGFAYANGFGGKRLPFYQNYNAGGIGSLRGFAYGAIGPKAIYTEDGRNFNKITGDVIGGNAMAVASLELITPTPFISDKYQHRVRTSLFVDAATVWDSTWKKHKHPGNLSQLDFGNYKRVRSSAGIAFQWNSPIGPLLFSYAKPIKKYQGDEIEQFQFSIGGSF